VLLSSHLLAEVEATVDRLVVIRAGQVVADGRLADLLSTSGLVARATDHTALLAALTRAGVPCAGDGDDGTVTIDTTLGSPPNTSRRWRRTRVRSSSSSAPPTVPALEQLFFALTTSPATATATDSVTDADLEEISR
jgi:ABC-2 type transport system ATP-binding protein